MHFNPFIFEEHLTHGIYDMGNPPIKNNQPIDGHHPDVVGLKAYPYLGRKLTENDIGKLILRTYPSHQYGVYRWDWVPNDSSEFAARREAEKLLSLNNDKVCTETGTSNNDVYWMTLDEWLAIPDKDQANESKKLQSEKKIDDFWITLDQWLPTSSDKEETPVTKKIQEMNEITDKMLETLRERSIKKIQISLSPASMAKNTTPIDDHQSDSVQRKVYPSYGRKLTKKDIGKPILRVYPALFNKSKDVYDWSWIPYDSSKFSGGITAEKLLSLNNDQVRTETGTSDNDGYWITLEEWFAIPKEPTIVAKSAKIDITEKISKNARQQFSYAQHSGISIHSTHFFDSKTLPTKVDDQKQNAQIEELWVHKKSALSTPFKPIDYSYSYPKPVYNLFHTQLPNLHATDAREILGLDPNVHDAAKVRKKYYELARVYHPDKGNISDEDFKKIFSAYQSLLDEIEGNYFSCSNSSQIEDDYSKAVYGFTQLRRVSKNITDTKKALLKWEHFCEELAKTGKKDCQEEQIFLLFQRLELKAKNYLNYLKFRLEVDGIQLPETCTLSEESANKLMDILQKLKALVLKYDLNNANTSWAHELISETFEKINWIIIDKFVAFGRLACEIYLKMNRPKQAIEIRRQVLSFCKQRKVFIVDGKYQALEDENSFSATWKLFQEKNQKKNESSKSQAEGSSKTATSFSGKEIEVIERGSSEKIISHGDKFKELKKNIKRNKEFFKVETALTFSATPITKMKDIFSKWHVTLSKIFYIYGAHTNDFGIEIQEMIISSEIDETSTDPIALAKASVGKFKLFHLIHDLEYVAEKLGIQIKKTKHPYPVRDYFFTLSNGEIRKQPARDVSKDLDSAESQGLYFSEKGSMRTINPFFKTKIGISNNQEILAENEATYFHSRDFHLYFEGGNAFALTNRDEKIQILMSSDHRYTCFQTDTSVNEEELKLKENLSRTLNQRKIYRVAEKMYTRGMLKIDGETGFLDSDKITKVFEYVAVQNIDLSQNEYMYRKVAIDIGLLKPFPEEGSWVENHRVAVTNFLFQKYLIRKMRAIELLVEPEDIHFLPSVMYHLDTFLKPGPKRSVFIANFAFNCDIIQGLLAEAEKRNLSEKDQNLLRRYLASSQKLHQELSPLLNKVGKKIEKAGLKPVPMPGVFFDTPFEKEQSYNFNLMNAISGWSKKTKRFFYITSGIQVGDQLGTIFMNLFVKFITSYQPDIDVFFIGSPKKNPKDFSEAMYAWNTANFQAGIHCFSFETKTATHTAVL